jgi:hypothetical protein
MSCADRAAHTLAREPCPVSTRYPTGGAPERSIGTCVVARRVRGTPGCSAITERCSRAAVRRAEVVSDRITALDMCGPHNSIAIGVPDLGNDVRGSDWPVGVIGTWTGLTESGYLRAAITALSDRRWVLDIVFQSTGSSSTSGLALTTMTAPPATPWAAQTASSEAISLSTIVTPSAT